MRIRYDGPIRGAYMLQRELSEARVKVSFPAPLERRGAGQDIIHVTMSLVNQAEGGLVGSAATLAAQRVVKAFRERIAGRGVKVEVEGSDDDGRPSAGFL